MGGEEWEIFSLPKGTIKKNDGMNMECGSRNTKQIWSSEVSQILG